MFIVCVRYSGGLAVGEGVGDCGCAYVTALMTMWLKLLKQFAGSTGQGHLTEGSEVFMRGTVRLLWVVPGTFRLKADNRLRAKQD